MIIEKKGDLLTCDADALVNTVNTVGVMGKGVALQFKRAFPDMYRDYQRACTMGEVVPGKMHVYYTKGPGSPSLIINFPTKRHWKEKSRLSDIRDGLTDLVRIVHDTHISSIALPPLGCGLGGLNWSDVYPLIKSAFSSVPDVMVFIFPPTLHDSPSHPVNQRAKLPLTWKISIILQIFERYHLFDYALTDLEAQKLLYFLQESGESLQLTFALSPYGPYAQELGHLLGELEGHYIERRAGGDACLENLIILLPSVHQRITAFMESNQMFYPESEARVKRVLDLIRGFETPYGLELLATVHWICTKELSSISSYDQIITKMQSWNIPRKNLLNEKHIDIAWRRLYDYGWINRESHRSVPVLPGLSPVKTPQ